MSAAVIVVAPEPVSWLDSLLDALPDAPPDARPDARPDSRPVRIFAPWMIQLGPLASRALQRAPASLRGFVSRRSATATDPVTGIPGWPLAEALVRTWVAGRADRHLRARLAVRRSVDAMAAVWLPRLQPAPRLVIAPSCAAQRTLAAARRLGATTVLFEDLPWIRGLQRDLDAAARAHPDCGFLQRYRAPGPVMARQEAERVLADWLIVTSRHARDQRQEAGFPDDRILDAIPDHPARDRDADSSADIARARRDHRPGRPIRVLLAGLAAARNGTVEALAAIAGRPDVELVVRARARGEGAGAFIEPAGLLDHPRVRAASPAETRDLRDIDLVIAPAWCETHLPEVALAAARGLPVIATPHGAGHVVASHTIAPGDAAALGRALDATLRDPRPARLGDIPMPLARGIARLCDQVAPRRPGTSRHPDDHDDSRSSRSMYASVT